MQETNRYHAQRFGISLHSSRQSINMDSWEHLSSEEFIAFLGIIIAMGILKLPTVRDYWCRKSIFCSTDIAAIMPRNRFEAILRHLHLRNTSVMPPSNHDKLFRVRPFLEYIGLRFRKAFYPFQPLAVDEMMIAFKGRSSIKQYMPLKPIKRGFKVWALCDGDTAYLLEFIIYEGAADTKDSTPLGLGGSVVCSLLQNYYNTNHVLFCDNYFTSVELFEFLLKNGVYACGTTRPTRRSFPVSSKMKSSAKLGISKPSHGEMRCTYVGNVLAIGWQDKRDVHMLTSLHDDSSIVIHRRQKDGSLKDQPVPKAVVDYNKHMGAVDIMDQRRSYYTCTRRSTRSWLRIFWWSVDTAIINSWILYNLKFAPNKLSQREFREELVYSMTTSWCTRRKHVGRKRKRNISLEFRREGRHFPIEGMKQMDCEACKEKGRGRHQSKILCDICLVALCVKHCFKEWHTKAGCKRLNV